MSTQKTDYLDRDLCGKLPQVEDNVDNYINAVDVVGNQRENKKVEIVQEQGVSRNNIC